MHRIIVSSEVLPPARNLWVVVYRVGGTHNFHWQATLAMPRAEAEAALAANKLAGFTTSMLYRYDQMLSIGLPETYDVGDPLPGMELPEETR